MRVTAGLTRKMLPALVGDDDGLRSIVDDGLEQRLLPQALGLGLPLSRQVVDDAGEVALAIDLVLADREMHGKGRAVLALAHDLAADADDLSLAGLAVLPDDSRRAGLR